MAKNIEPMTVQLNDNYVGTTRSQPRSLRDIAKMINERKSQIEQKFVEIGALLNEAKAIWGKTGGWGGWLEDNFELSQRSANRLMRIAEYFSNSPALSNLGLTKTKSDILLRLDNDKIEEFIDEHNLVELSTRELEDVVRECNKTTKTQKGKTVYKKNKSFDSVVDLHGKVDFLGDLINSLLDVCMGIKDDSKSNDIYDVCDGLRRLCERTIDRIQDSKINKFLVPSDEN